MGKGERKGKGRAGGLGVGGGRPLRLPLPLPSFRILFRAPPAARRVSLAPALRARVAPAFSPGAPGYDPCHDVFHLDRVARNAALLAEAEGADAEVVACAAYLHDLDRVPLATVLPEGAAAPFGLDRTGEKDPLAAARAHLAAVRAPEPLAARVLEAVERHKDKSFAPGGVRPRSREAEVLSDADKLEAIGAIGVARAFSYGGLKGRPLWDGAPTVVPEQYVSGANGTTVQHFYDKLLRLKGDFATETGRRMAEERHAFLEAFLGAFFAEWRLTPPAPSAPGASPPRGW